MPISTRAPRSTTGARRLRRPTRPGGTNRRPRSRQRLALLVAVPLLVLGLAACEPTREQETVRSLINQSRQAQGLPGLADDVTVRIKAQAWANHLASTGRLAHSSLSSGLDVVPWVAVVENVGVGTSIRSVHETYMRSPGHRANILDRRWDRVGTGHAIGRDGRTYTVQVFVDVG